MELERLQKVLAEAGIASRRASEKIITDGRVKVNGEVVTLLGTKVRSGDIILVDNKPITKEEKVYFLLNKPQGYITSLTDKNKKRIIASLLGDDVKSKRVFPVEILDADIAGALILTNDGDLAYKLTRSHKEISKTYQIRVEGILNQDAVNKLMKGFTFNGKMTKRARIDNVDFDREHRSTLFYLTIPLVKNSEVKDIMKSLGFPVKKVKIQSFAGVSIEGLSEGEYRQLKPHEIKQLYGI